MLGQQPGVKRIDRPSGARLCIDRHCRRWRRKVGTEARLSPWSRSSTRAAAASSTGRPPRVRRASRAVISVDLHGLPVATGQHIGEEIQGRGDRQVRRRVVRPGPVELEKEARPVVSRLVGAVGNIQWPNLLLPVAADVEEARSFGRAEPLVGVPGVVGGAQFVAGSSAPSPCARRRPACRCRARQARTRCAGWAGSAPLGSSRG